MISAQHQQFQPKHHHLSTNHLMTDTISQPRQANPSNPSTVSAATSVSMNGDINARRDAASMMMSMSHLMDAAAVHAQQQQSNPATPTAAGLPSAQSRMSSIQTQVNSHLNHTTRGPHKKRTASTASLDDNRSSSRSGPAHGNHLINGGGVIRMPMTGSTVPSTVSGAAVSSTNTSGGKGKATSSSSSGSGTSSTTGPLTEEEKKAERRAANRRSAFQSRQRRKILIEDLQRTVAALSKDNNDLRKNNDEIRSQLEAALLENRQLRQITSSLSAQAHAQVAAQQAQQAAPGSQQQTTGSPSISAQQAPPPVPSISQQQQPQTVAVPAAPPPPFTAQSLSSSTAALTNFLTSFSSQAAGAASSSEQQQHIFNAKIALMAAQSRVSELEHHQAAQAQAAANAVVAQQQQHQVQLQAQAAASAALGLAHVQSATPGASALSDGQHLIRLQELLARGISNASAASAAPVPTAAPPAVAPTVAATAGAPTSTNGISAAGVDLSHLRSLLEAQQQQQQAQQQSVAAVQPPGPITTAPESPRRPSVQEQRVVGSPVAVKMEVDSAAATAGSASVAASEAAPVAPQVPPTANSASSAPTVRSAALSTTPAQDAPGIQLLIESLRAGQNGGAGNGAPPLDEAVRNYIKQQQLAQQQAQQTSNVASAIKTESN